MMKKSDLKGKVLLQGGKVVNPSSDSIQKQDILLDDGKIALVEQEIEEEKADKVIELTDRVIAPGFIDIHTHLREPGQEDSETIRSGAQAALAGGFTQICCMPNTIPPISTEGDVLFVKNKAQNLEVKVHPVASITKGRAGKELSEFSELVEAGAVAFSDDGSPVESSQIMRNALEYSKIVDRPIVNHSVDQDLKNGGIINEGKVSAQTGLNGNPPIAEEIMVQRDLKIAEFTDAKLHIPHVTTKGAVELIRQAKERGVKVSAEATPHHLSLTEEYLKTFDTRGKVAPPLREEKDRQALIQGLKDGTIDVIATDHAPHTYNKKETTLDLAAYGMIGMESAFGLMMDNLVNKNELSILELVKKFTINPAQIMDLDICRFQPGEKAEFTIFDENEWWVFNEESVYSKSKNTPFFGTEMTGRVKKVIIGDRVIEIY